MKYLSDIPLDENEIDFLKKGLKFGLPPLDIKKATDSLIADLAAAPKTLENHVQQEIFETIKNNPVERIPEPILKTEKSIKRKMKDHDLTISRADKGNTVVVMKRSDYKAKVLDFIESNNGKKNSFNFEKYCDLIRKRIKNSEYIIEPRDKKYLTVMNHFPPSPIRPPQNT